VARIKTEVYAAIRESFVVPLFSTSDTEKARAAVALLADGGFPVVEMTHRSVNSLRVFEAVAAAGGRVALGAGSVVDAATAAQYVNAGARFIVGPAFEPEVQRYCNRINLLYIPGCATLTEILRAYEGGALLVKLFPANALGGPAFLKAVKGPCPWIEAVPTGGVEPTRENLAGWTAAGAFAVAMGSNLLPKEDVEAGRWEEIGKRAAAVRQIVASLRR